MDILSVRSELLALMRSILVSDPVDLYVIFNRLLLPEDTAIVFAADDRFPAICFYGPAAGIFKLHAVEDDGGFDVTMGFGPANTPARLRIPAAAIVAWSYYGARITLPVTTEQEETVPKNEDLRPRKGLRIAPPIGTGDGGDSGGDIN